MRQQFSSSFIHPFDCIFIDATQRICHYIQITNIKHWFINEWIYTYMYIKPKASQHIFNMIIDCRIRISFISLFKAIDPIILLFSTRFSICFDPFFCIFQHFFPFFHFLSHHSSTRTPSYLWSKAPRKG